MKSFFVSIVFVALALSGCARKSSTGESSPTENQGGHNADLVQMGLSAQGHVGLVVAPAQIRQLSEYLKATGTVQPLDNLVAEVSPLARGRIIAVHARVGDRVKAGQILATFDNLEASDLFAQEQSAQAELDRLNAQLVLANRQQERSQRLAAIGAGAEKDYESAKAEAEGVGASIRSQQALIAGIKRRLHSLGLSDAHVGGEATITTLKAPFAGVVTKAQASPGDVVEAGREVFTVADLSRVWVQAEVYEKDLGRIRTGQQASITVDTYPDQTFDGRVTYISDVLDPQTRTARVRCEVPNPDMRLKTDMFANIELPTKFSKQALAVPSGAVQEVDGKNVVFVRRTATQFEKRQVEKGVTVNGYTEIVSGLALNQPVVTDGAFHLKSILAGGQLGDD